jgi:hypothetical protein
MIDKHKLFTNNIRIKNGVAIDGFLTLNEEKTIGSSQVFNRLKQVASRKSQVQFCNGDLTPTQNLPVIEPGDLNPRNLLNFCRGVIALWQ